MAEPLLRREAYTGRCSWVDHPAESWTVSPQKSGLEQWRLAVNPERAWKLRRKYKRFSFFDLRKPPLLWFLDLAAVTTIGGVTVFLTNLANAVMYSFVYVATREVVNHYARFLIRREGR